MSAVEEKESEPECVQRTNPKSGVAGRAARLQPRQLRDGTCLLPQTASSLLSSLPHCSCLLALHCLLVSLLEGEPAQKGLGWSSWLTESFWIICGPFLFMTFLPPITRDNLKVG